MVDNDGLSKFPEYQYHLKDHLGNVRLTFSAEPVTESNTATLETIHEDDESATFLRYAETTKINSTLFDHTGNGDTHYAVRLNGSANERIGLAKSLAVMTGDTVRAEVFAKYLDPDQGNWTAALQNLMTAIAGGTAPMGTVIEAVPPVGGDGLPFAGLLDAAKAGDTGTRAYLNILLFDENLGFLDAAYVPVSMAAREDGTNVPHEKLSQEIVVQQPGYAYIYFSNDNDQPLEVFFDDFTVTHSHSAIVQADDYYPFGMTFNGYKRENSMVNRYLYQGKEIQNELGLDIYSFEIRNYDAALGRWWQVDPKVAPHESPYVSMGNNPIRYIDPLGDTIRDNNGIVANYRTYLNNRISRLQGMLGDKNFDFAKYGTSREAVAGLVSSLQGVGGELDALEASEQVYNVSFDGSLAAGEGGVSFNSGTGEVNVNFGSSSDVSSIAGVIGHEMLHAYQFETGQISLAANNSFYGSLYDLGDETASYRREHLVAGPISSGSHINNQWTKQFGATMTPPAYQTLPSGPIDINSSQGLMIRLQVIRQGAFSKPVTEVFKGWKSYVKPLKTN